MNGWLDDVLAGYLDRVSEREFDPVFITYLRSAGYGDIHQTHGSFEFGKDFIAKRGAEQWAFQTKAGDINMSTWRQIRSQVDEMLWNDISHPSFDAKLPRTAVLVTTGRLIGGAAADAQQYEMSLGHRGPPRKRLRGFFASRRSQRSFEVWDREHLLHGLAQEPAMTLNGWGERSLRELLGLLADIDRRRVFVQTIERATRGWFSEEMSQRTCLAGSVVGNRLLQANRADLACTTSYALIRAAALGVHRGSSDSGSRFMDIARTLFDVYSTRIVDDVESMGNDAAALFNAGTEMPGLVSYPVRCSVILETVGMLGLLRAAEGDTGEAARIAGLLAQFVDHQLGAAHPISDRWAVSLVPAAALLRRFAPEMLIPWLERVIVWICDRYDELPGLASVNATPDDEVRYLLGDPYEHIGLHRRTQSYLATIVLDLASVLELPTLYGDAFNDFSAVDIAFPVVEPLDEPGQYVHDGTGVVVEANVRFDEDPNLQSTWTTAAHHRRAVSSYTLQRAGRSWELMAIGLLLRDRHFLNVTRELAGLREE